MWESLMYKLKKVQKNPKMTWNKPSNHLFMAEHNIPSWSFLWQSRSFQVRSATISRDKLQAATAVKRDWFPCVLQGHYAQQDTPTGCTLGKNKQTEDKSNSLFNLVLMLLTHIFWEEDDKERSDQVINSLDIPTGRVSDGPNKQNSFEDLGKWETKKTW